MRPQRIVVALTGTTSLAWGLSLLRVIGDTSIERHVILTDQAEAALRREPNGPQDLRAIGEAQYSEANQAARVSSGSFLTLGMIVMPCNHEAFTSISMGLADNLVHRAADVTIKERRPLVLATVDLPAAPEVERARGRLSAVPDVMVTNFPNDGTREQDAFFRGVLDCLRIGLPTTATRRRAADGAAP